MIQKTDNWYILGAGAIGHLLACSFAKKCIPSILLLRENDKSACSEVLYIKTSENTPLDLKFQSVNLLKDKHIKHLILTVKSHQVKEALETIKPKLHENCQLLLMQNGMGIVEIAMEVLSNTIDMENIYPCSNTHGVFLSKDSSQKTVVNHAGFGEVLIGRNYLATHQSDHPVPINLFDELRLDFIEVLDIEHSLWLKVAVNSVINPLTAIYQCTNGELLNNSECKELVYILIEELASLFENTGIPLEQAVIEEAVLGVIHKTSTNKSSMYQDIINRRKTENDAITGVLISKARKNRINLTTHEKLYSQIKLLDEKAL